jgi:hypothetical protein
MSLNTSKFAAFASATLLSITAIVGISAPANAAECPHEVTNQASNDKPKNNLRVVSPFLTDENSIRRYDFEAQFTMDCDWFGVGMRFFQVYAPYGLRTNVTFQATTPTGKPLVNTKVTLRVNKGYSNSNAPVRANGIKARPAPSNASDGANISGTTDANGMVSFAIQAPDDCTTYGGLLPTAPNSPSEPTPNDKNADPTTDCFSQLLPSITGEKTDSADFVELHYYDAATVATTGPLGAAGNLTGTGSTVTYDNKKGGVLATLKVSSTANWTETKIDGMELKVGDLVLIKDQLTAAHNGLYDVTSIGSVNNKTDFVFTRDGSNDEIYELDRSSQSTLVMSGTVNGGKSWNQTNSFETINDVPASIGVTDITFAGFGSAEDSDSVTLSVLSPVLDATNSISENGVIQSYSPILTKQVIAVQAVYSSGSLARNVPVSLKINLADSGANAKVSAGFVGNAANGALTTVVKADATKTTSDQLVLNGVTDSFGTATFELHNTDTTAIKPPATPISPVQVPGAKFANLVVETVGKVGVSEKMEFYYFKPIPPTSIAITATGRKITVTLTNAATKRSTITITGLKAAAVTPTSAKRAYTYIVKKGKITVKVVSNGKTLTKVFNIK